MWRNITAQAVPLTIAQLVQLLYNVVDRVYIGHLTGTGALALSGIGLVFPFTTLIMAFSAMVGTGGAPLFSIKRGAKEDEKARWIMGNSFTLVLFFSVIIMVICYVFRVPILYLFGASDVTIVYAEAYLKIYLIGVVFSMITTGMNGFITSLGFPRTAMWTTVIGALLNLALDPVFIFVFSMGVRGAALATVISQCVSAVWVLRFLIANKTDFPLRLSYMKLQMRAVRKILTLGLSGFVQNITTCLVQIVCNATLQAYGGDLYVGIMTILTSVREMAYLPVVGICSGAQPVLGFNYGAKLFPRVKEGIRFITVICVIYTAAMWAVILLFPGAFMHIFTNDPQTIEYGIPALRLFILGFVFMSLAFVGQYVFVGLGKAKRAIFFSILRKAIIVVPLTLLLPMAWGLGTTGVFIAESISNVIGGVACFTTMWVTLYRKL